MTILSESVVKVGTLYGFIGLFVFVAFMVLGMMLAKYDHLDASIVVLGLAIVIFVIIMIYGVEPHKRIKVILSDDYPAVKLYEEYDVEGRDGDIWILQDKEPMEKEK